MSNQLKSVMSKDFVFVPEKAGPQVYVSLGVLAVVLVLLIAVNTQIEGEFEVWWMIFPVVVASVLVFMLPQIRYQQRVTKYKEYLRKQPREVLNSALENDLDEESREVVAAVLSELER